jgi:hypothetical protein
MPAVDQIVETSATRTEALKHERALQDRFFAALLQLVEVPGFFSMPLTFDSLEDVLENKLPDIVNAVRLENLPSDRLGAVENRRKIEEAASRFLIELRAVQAHQQPFQIGGNQINLGGVEGYLEQNQTAFDPATTRFDTSEEIEVAGVQPRQELIEVIVGPNGPYEKITGAETVFNFLLHMMAKQTKMNLVQSELAAQPADPQKKDAAANSILNTLRLPGSFADIEALSQQTPGVAPAYRSAEQILKLLFTKVTQILRVPADKKNTIVNQIRGYLSDETSVQNLRELISELTLEAQPGNPYESLLNYCISILYRSTSLIHLETPGTLANQLETLNELPDAQTVNTEAEKYIAEWQREDVERFFLFRELEALHNSLRNPPANRDGSVIVKANGTSRSPRTLSQADHPMIESLYRRLAAEFERLKTEPNKIDDELYPFRVRFVEDALDDLGARLDETDIEIGLQRRYEDLPRPTEDDFGAWERYFDTIFLDLGEVEFQRYAMDMIDRLYIQDSNYDSRDVLKEAPEGMEFRNLDSYYRNLPNRRGRHDELSKNLAQQIEYYKAFFYLVSLSGPGAESGAWDGISAMVVGDPQKEDSGDKYPEFWTGNFAFMLGSYDPEKPHEDKDKGREWEFAPECWMALRRLRELLVEEASSDDLSVQVPVLNADGTPVLDNGNPVYEKPGNFSFSRSYWMGGSGGFHNRLKRRMLAETMNPTALPEEQWTIQGKQYRDIDIEMIWRTAYLCGMFTRAKNQDFVRTVWALGASPPKFFEAKTVSEEFPIAVILNKCTKEILCDPAIEAGLKIDRRWLAVNAKMFGVFQFIANEQSKNPPRLTEVNLRGVTTMSLLEIQDLDEGVIEAIFGEIATSGRPGDVGGAEKYLRFQKLLRSIYYSEAFSELWGVKHTQFMHAADIDGGVDGVRLYMEPILATPLQAVAEDGLRERFAKKGVRLQKLTELHRVVNQFHKMAYHDEPPKLGGKYDEDLEKLGKDFAKLLNQTSILRAEGGDYVNWQEILDGFEYRIRVLFATFKKVYPAYNPEVQYGGSFGIPSKSLVEFFIKAIEDSGQTVSFISVFVKDHGEWKEKQLTFSDPYDREEPDYSHGAHAHTPAQISLKEYFLRLVNPVNPHNKNIARQTLYAGTEHEGVSKALVKAKKLMTEMPVGAKKMTIRQMESSWGLGARQREQTNAFFPGGESHTSASAQQEKEANDSKASKK